MLTNESKLFKRLNFIVTQYTSYINDRSKNFAHKDCEEHFYPKEGQSTTEVDDSFEALKFFDFGALLAICSFMVLVSVVSLFLEIIFSKFTHRQMSFSNPVNISPNIYKFSYSSKCADKKSAMLQLNHLHTNLLNKDDLDISYSEVVVIPCDNMFDICFSLQFELNNTQKLDAIIEQFDAFTAYLDSISQK